MPFFVARFGPLLGCNTERYESFNSTFRQCSILSNRHAPSLDIAKSFHIFDQAKHLSLGGFYYNPVSRKFMQAGPGVIELGRYSRFVTRILGVQQNEVQPQPGKLHFMHKTSSKLRSTGSVTVRRAAAKTKTTWSTSNSRSAPRSEYIDAECMLEVAAYCIAQDGEKVATGSHVVYQVPIPVRTQVASLLILSLNLY